MVQPIYRDQGNQIKIRIQCKKQNATIFYNPIPKPHNSNSSPQLLRSRQHQARLSSSNNGTKQTKIVTCFQIKLNNQTEWNLSEKKFCIYPLSELCKKQRMPKITSNLAALTLKYVKHRSEGIHREYTPTKEALLKSSACNLPPRGAEGREEENKRWCNWGQ